MSETKKTSRTPASANSKNTKSESNERRRRLRFGSDPLTVAELFFLEDSQPLDDPDLLKYFQADQMALVVNESYQGCHLVIALKDKTPDLTVGRRCIVRIGTLPPLPAAVRWLKPLDRDIISLGMEYLK